MTIVNSYTPPQYEFRIHIRGDGLLKCITGKGVVELAYGCLEDSVDKCEPGVSKAGWCVERGSGHIDRTRH